MPPWRSSVPTWFPLHILMPWLVKGVGEKTGRDAERLSHTAMPRFCMQIVCVACISIYIYMYTRMQRQLVAWLHGSNLWTCTCIHNFQPCAFSREMECAGVCLSCSARGWTRAPLLAFFPCLAPTQHQSSTNLLRWRLGSNSLKCVGALLKKEEIARENWGPLSNTEV